MDSTSLPNLSVFCCFWCFHYPVAPQHLSDEHQLLSIHTAPRIKLFLLTAQTHLSLSSPCGIPATPCYKTTVLSLCPFSSCVLHRKCPPGPQAHLTFVRLANSLSFRSHSLSLWGLFWPFSLPGTSPFFSHGPKSLQCNCWHFCLILTQLIFFLNF